MSDLELTRLCAEAMNYPPGSYDPLYDDAQAMTLVKALHLTIDRPNENGDWFATYYYDDTDKNPRCGVSKDLNRAIAQCVAKMQQAKR